MYHYVRDLPRTRYPRVKGLLTSHFEGQLDYISRHYSVCTLGQVLGASRGESELPANACVLSFDDGFLDHYETVFPLLLRRGFTGAFFPPARPIEEHRVLDVHKIHFILASTEDYSELCRDLFRKLAEYRLSFSIPPDEDLWKRHAVASRFDPAEVVFFKRMLQWVLAAPLRSILVDRLFASRVTRDERSFAFELYLGVSQLREMATAGMDIGGHGYNHVWLGTLPEADQAEEISRTVSFLRDISGRTPVDWAISYPYGSFNADTLEVVSRMGCAIGLTTAVGLADICRPLELRRLDTNDFPVAGDAALIPWTNAIRAESHATPLS
jgi:peptidoglycan/xylan/chitin deacetylase (PgdA/CDA1 family)